MTELEKINERAIYEKVLVSNSKSISRAMVLTYIDDIQSLLKLTSKYEHELLQFVPVTYLDDIKKEVFR